MVSTQFRQEVHALRALAVISVLMFHLGVRGWGGGFTGVDVFFVISGFLITRVISVGLMNRQFSILDFYRRRVNRIYPALIPVVAVSSFFSFCFFTASDFAAFSQSAIYSLLSVSNIGFNLEAGYFDIAKMKKPLLHTWSLGVEEQFYLIWPLCLCLFYRLGRRLLVGVSLILFVSLIGSLLWNNIDSTFFLMPFRAWQFAAGGVVALLILRGWEVKGSLSLLFTLVGLSILGFGLHKVDASDYPGFNAIIPTMGAVLVILGGNNLLVRLIFNNTPTKFFADISYSLYLWHWPIIVFYTYVEGEPTTWSEISILAAFSIFFASLSYYFVEKRFGQAGVSRDEPRSSEIAGFGLMSAILLVVVFNAHVWAQTGWSWRVKDSGYKINLERKRVVCHKGEFDLGGRSCVFGVKKQGVDFALIGDSHSAALSTGLEALLIKKGASAVRFTLPGSLPFLNVYSYDGGRRKEKNFDAFFEQVSGSDIENIVIHARFLVHWYSDYGDLRYPKYVGTEDFGVTNIEQSQQLFLQSFRRTLRNLRDQGKRVFIIGAIPFPGDDFKHCLSRPSYLGYNVLDYCNGFDSRGSYQEALTVNTLLRQITLEEGVNFYDPLEKLCPDQSCMLSLNGQLIYRDNNHLSRFGARLVSRRFLQSNRSVIGKGLKN